MVQETLSGSRFHSLFPRLFESCNRLELIENIEATFFQLMPMFKAPTPLAEMNSTNVGSGSTIWNVSPILRYGKLSAANGTKASLCCVAVSRSGYSLLCMRPTGTQDLVQTL